MLEKIEKYWIGLCVVAVAVMYFLFDRRGRQLSDLKEEVKREKIGRELQKLAETADKSSADYAAARDRYRALKRQHPELWGGAASVRPSADAGGPSADRREDAK